MFTRRRQSMAVPEVGDEAQEFNLPSAQGGQLRLSMRTVRGPVVVVFFRGLWSEEDLAYFKALAAKEDEINHAGASVVGVGIIEPDEAQEFVRETGMKSYVLYDYVRVTTRQWGLLEKDKEHGEYARPAVFIVGSDRKISESWVGERPSVEEILAKVTGITGLPKPPEEEKPEETSGDEKADEEKPKKMSAEERERIKAERRAAREAGKSVKTGTTEEKGTGEEASEPQAGGKPKKMTAEERERIKAERRAAREAGKSLKKPSAQGAPQEGQGETGREDTAPSAEAAEGGKPEEE